MKRFPSALSALSTALAAMVLVSCEWNDSRDNPHDPRSNPFNNIYAIMSLAGGGSHSSGLSAQWNDNTEPKITGATGATLTFAWSPLCDVASYRIYWVQSWGPPVNETEISNTAETTATIAADQIDYTRTYRVKALDSSNAVIDSRVLKGYANQLVLGYIQGTVTDDFSAGLDSRLYSVYNYNGPSTQYSIASGYLELTMDDHAEIPGNDPHLYFGYDPQGKRYVRITMDWYEHRVNSSYLIGIKLFSSANNLDAGIYQHSYGVSTDGVCWSYETYDQSAYEPVTALSSLLYSSITNDTWFSRTILLDTESGAVTITDGLNGPFMTSMPYRFPQKIVFAIYTYSIGAGDYIRIDNLDIRSSDSPF